MKKENTTQNPDTNEDNDSLKIASHTFTRYLPWNKIWI
jgi:hypothetical protein